MPSHSVPCFLYAGAWAGRSGAVEGIQAFSYDAADRKLLPIGSFGSFASMSCLVVDGDLLLSCVEGPDADLVLSFRILPDGTLKELDRVHTTGTNIAHLALDRARRRLFAVNLSGCSVSMIAYDEAGALRLCDCCPFTDPGSYTLGLSSLAREQAAAYPHASALMPDGDHLCVCGRGSDKLYVLAIEEGGEKLTLRPERTVPMDSGEGARHIVFSADGRYAYVNTEAGSTVYVFAVDADAALTRLQKWSTLDPSRENPPRGSASVCVLSPDGRHLYVGNRGQNNIACFPVDSDGLLGDPRFYDCCGISPRGLSFDGAGQVLFCSCNGSGTISLLERSRETGALGPCLQRVEGIPGSANAALWAPNAK